MRDIPHLGLKAVFAIHFILATWAVQGLFTTSLLFYNILYLLCLLWAIHAPESDEPIQFALFISVASEFFDIIYLSVFSPFSDGSFAKFVASMIIINMIVRVGTILYLLRLGQTRGGTLATLFSSPAMGLGRQDYEDISHPVPQNSDFASI